VPTAYYWDEAAILLDSKCVAETGFDVHHRPWYQVIYPSYGDYKLPFYIWMSALSVKIYGVNDWVIRLPNVVMGLLTIIVGGLLAKELVDRHQSQVAQLMTMLVLTLTPWSLMFSRTGFEGYSGQALLALSIYLLLKSRKKWWLMIFSALVGGLATYAYFSVRFVWPVVTVGYYVGWVFDYHQLIKMRLWPFFQSIFIWLIGPLIIFGLTFLPMAKSPLYHDMDNFRLSAVSILNNFNYALMSNELRAQAGNKFIDRLLFHRHWLLIRELASNYADNLSLNFLFVSGDPNLRHGTGQNGLFLLPLILAAFWGLWSLFDQNRRAWCWLIIWWLVALLPASVPENTPHALRSLNALVPLSIIIGFGLTQIFLMISNSRIIRLFKFSYGLSLIFSAAIFINYYFTQYPVSSAEAWQSGYVEAAAVVNQRRSEVIKVYVEQPEKLYLWIFASSGINCQEFQSLPSHGFQFSSWQNVEFAYFPWDKAKEMKGKYLIVGDAGQIKDQLVTKNIQPSWQQEIFTLDGHARFLAVELSN